MAKTERFYMEWTGDSFAPASSLQQERCDKHLVVGEKYWLEEVHQRSPASHNHFFAIMQEAFNQLPEEVARNYENVDQFRGDCLIKAGHCDVYGPYIAKNPSDGKRIVNFLKQILAGDERHHRIVANDDGSVVVIVPKSQSLKAMNRDQFQQSKQDCLEIAADVLGITIDQLVANTGMAA